MDKEKSPSLGPAQIVIGILAVVLVLGYNRYVNQPPVAKVDFPATVWKSFESPTYNFRIQYPADFTINQHYRYTRLGKNKTISGVAFNLPKTYWQGTNLSSDSYVSVETSNLACEAKNFVPDASKDKEMMLAKNGRTYTQVTHDEGVTNSNFYHEVVYASAASRGACYIARLFLHSVDINNLLDSKPTTKRYDEAGITTVFENMLATLQF